MIILYSKFTITGFSKLSVIYKKYSFSAEILILKVKLCFLLQAIVRELGAI